MVFLILFPVAIAGLLLIARGDKARAAISTCGGIIIAVASIVLAVMFLGQPETFFQVDEGAAHAIGYLTLAIDIALACYIVGKGIIYKRWLPIILAVVQVIIVVWFEFTSAESVVVTDYLYIDTLSIIMALVIGIIGSGICVYAIGYMRDFQAHEPEGAKDRRPTFFAICFAFLGAMFMLVFSNSMMWLFTAWEITTVCSFALIGYTRTEEAINNSFRQIIMNLIGGLAFAIALVCIVPATGTLEFDAFIALATDNPALALPVALLALAGITKAAQMPFHSWLLGAMVAPTPTSALLHSSTMVKAGVFLLIKLAPCFGITYSMGGLTVPGIMVMLVGGATFMLCSFMAISQSNAKRVLAYSTIANLGLIAACAGTDTAEGVWAAIFLLVFHAAAKSLLFLTVGTAEHHIGSRNIEDMDLLFTRMPKLARFMMFGIMVMFVAPFGMLISKWAALASFVDSGNLILVILLAFGSAATFFFWGKWLGKLSGIAGETDSIEDTIWPSEWASLGLMAGLAAICCVLFPLISSKCVVPYLASIPAFAGMNVDAIGSTNLIIMAVIAAACIIVVLALPKKSKVRQAPVYLAGASVDNMARTFKGSLSQPLEATQSNWYMEETFGEKRIDKYAFWGGVALEAIPIIWTIYMFVGMMGGAL